MRHDSLDIAAIVIFGGCLALAGCAELRKGWVKVDFLEPPSKYIVCQLDMKGDDMEATCVSLETIEKEVQRREAAKKGDL